MSLCPNSPASSTESNNCSCCGKLHKKICKFIHDLPRILSDSVVIAMKGILVGKPPEQIQAEVIQEIQHDVMEYAEKELENCENDEKLEKVKQS